MRLRLAHIVCLLSMSLLATSSVDAQEVRAAFEGADPAKHTMKIGEQVLLELSVQHHDTSNIRWPKLGDTLDGGVEIVDRSEIQSTETKGIFTLTQNLMITAWDSGHYAIEPFLFMIDDDSLLTKALLLSIGSVPVDTTKAAKDIKNIYADNYKPDALTGFLDDIKENWPWILAGILIAIAAIAFWIYRRKQRKEPKIAPKPQIPPHILAKQELDKLESEELWQKGKVKEFHVRLNNILRLYIEQRFRVRAMEQTTGEILQNLRYSDIDEEAKPILKRALLLSDMVKYAKEKPIATENEQSLNDAKLFVKATEPENKNV